MFEFFLENLVKNGSNVGFDTFFVVQKFFHNMKQVSTRNSKTIFLK